MWSNNFSQYLELRLETPWWLAAVLSGAGAAAALAWGLSGFPSPFRHTLAAASLCWGIGLAWRWARGGAPTLAMASSGEVKALAGTGDPPVPVPVEIPHWWRMHRLVALRWRADDGRSGIALWRLSAPVADVQRRALVRLRLPQLVTHRVEWF